MTDPTTAAPQQANLTGAITSRDAGRAFANQVSSDASYVARYNEAAQLRNERIGATLATISELPAESDPSVWYRWWYDKNEYYYPREKPLLTSTNRNKVALTVCSCFNAGTPVWTSTGLLPIESIQVGDLVLAQDVESGELAFQPVLQTTRRPPSELIKVTANGESLHVTRSHPLWVSGTGWQMAKELQPGQNLHTVDGFAPISAVETWADAEAYNLVVDRFASYFIGKTGLLVHDNTLRQPTECVVPGQFGAR